MIFNVPGHIDMIRNGTKTQTRRLNRGTYLLEAERKKPHYTGYAVQRKRGAPAEQGIRIVMDRIWEEQIMPPFDIRNNPSYSILREEDAWAEGGYTPEEFEKLFRKINPNWNGIIRYGFQFHVVEVQTR